MSQSLNLSPAITQRIESFAEEIREAAQQAAFLMENTSARMENRLLDEVRLSLEGLASPLLEVIGAAEDEDRDVYPLPQPTPHFLPLALTRVTNVGRAFPLLVSLAAAMSEDERLAAEYLAGRIHYLSETAGFIRATVLEELPPVEVFGDAKVSVAYA